MDRMVAAIALIDIMMHLESLERLMEILHTLPPTRKEFIDQKMILFVRGILLRFIRLRRTFRGFNDKVRRM